MAGWRARDLTVRAAVYYAPAFDDPLWTAGCDWLGRDPQSGRRTVQPERDEVTTDPRRYGFHCTLKPPMRLAHSWDAFLEDAAILASGIPPFDLPSLVVADLGGFLALRETSACPPLHDLADACVTSLDAHRWPADPAEIERRRKSPLTPQQDAMLLDWGYPHVLATWRFHMTLTRRLDPDERLSIRTRAEAHFAAALAQSRRVTDICLFTQAAPDQAFMLAERLPLGG
jgi:putative phosphonate metabolism protein